MKKSTKNKILTLLIVIAFLGSSITYALISAFPSQNQVQTNWKAQIAIVISGEQQLIPADIGINNQTTAKVFTINSDGVIYKTGTGDVMLKDFFDEWRQNFNSTCILDYCNTNTSSMKMYVWDPSNSKWVENYDYELYTIKNNDVIMIDYR